MAKTDSPLFGMAADGQIGQSVVFARWKGVRYARRYVVPSNPRTSAQLGVRNVFSFLVAMFKLAPAVFRAPWEAKARGEPMTPGNAFMKANATFLIGETSLQNLAISTGVLGGLAPAGGALSGGTGEVTVSLTPPELPPGWGVRSLVACVIPDQSPQDPYVGGMQVSEVTQGPYTATFSGLTAGQYFASGYFTFNRDDGRIAYGPPVADIVAVS